MKTTKANGISDFLLSLFFPRRCVGCRAFDEDLCESCAATLEAPLLRCLFCNQESASGATCNRCKKHFALDGLVYAASYHQPLSQKIIHALKYERCRSLAPLLAQRMTAKNTPPLRNAALISVPLAAKRTRERGFNQAEHIAAGISDITGIIFSRPEPIIKIRNTPPQAQSFSRKERFANTKGAFALRANTALAGKSFVVVDDVATSGATLHEIARVLKQHGASAVWGWVFAHQ